MSEDLRGVLQATPLENGSWDPATWSVYLMRVRLNVPGATQAALKIGMVGTGTIANRRNEHEREFGATEILRVWSLEHAAHDLGDLAWRIVEQYEARLQFAPEFENPTARLRRLHPLTNAYSFEWFVDDQSVIDAFDKWAPHGMHAPLGWRVEDSVD